MTEHSDNQLIDLYKGGDNGAFEVLYNRYKYMIRACSRRVFLVGGDSEDAMQEGVIGFIKAVNTFQQNGESSFSTYAYTCVKNSLLTAVTKAQSTKNRVLNQSVSIYDNAFELDPVALDPEQQVIIREDAHELTLKINQALSGFEITVLKLYLEGLSYIEIAEQLDKSSKSIDNALQRIKRKISKTLA